MSRYGGGAGELRIGMHTAHGVRHAVAGGACRHVVRVQRAARAAARGNGEILLAVFNAPLFVCSRNGVLETGGVGGVAGYGYVHVLVAHYGNALVHVVRAVAEHLRAVAVAESGGLYYGKLARVLVVFGFNVGEAVYAADYIRRVLAKAVEYYLERLLAHLVRRAGYADCTLCRGKAFVSGKEGEAMRGFGKQHRAKIAVAQTHLTLIGNGAGYAERLQAFAYAFGRFRRALNALLQRYRRAEGICPNRVFKGDGLNALHYAAHVYAMLLGEGFACFKAVEPILCKHGAQGIYSSFVSFKSDHLYASLYYCLRGSITVTASAKRP